MEYGYVLKGLRLDAGAVIQAFFNSSHVYTSEQGAASDPGVSCAWTVRSVFAVSRVAMHAWHLRIITAS